MVAKCYIRVVNWEAFQHYGDRMPPWIKLHNTVLEDPIIAALPDHSKAHVFGIWLLASRLKNKIPNDAKFIGARINASRAVDLNSLIFASFVEHHPECLCGASAPLAKCSTDKNEKRVDETRAEGRRAEETPAFVPPSAPPPDVRAEAAIRDGTVALERKLLSAVARLAGKVTPERDELSIMREVTAYKRGDGTIVAGRANPSGMSAERLEKSLADALAWLAELEKTA